MALLRWIHLRKLVPLSDLIQGLEKARRPQRRCSAADRPARPAPPRPPARPTQSPQRHARQRSRPSRRVASGAPRSSRWPPREIKNAFLEEIRKAKKFFHGTVVAQAQRIEVEADRIVFTFAPQHRALRGQLDQTRA